MHKCIRSVTQRVSGDDITAADAAADAAAADDDDDDDDENDNGCNDGNEILTYISSNSDPFRRPELSQFAVAAACAEFKDEHYEPLSRVQ